jgi:hypothetical protein
LVDVPADVYQGDDFQPLLRETGEHGWFLDRTFKDFTTTGPPASWPSSRRPRHEHLQRGPQIAARSARCPVALDSLLPFRPIALRGGRQFSRTPGRCWSRVS